MRSQRLPSSRERALAFAVALGTLKSAHTFGDHWLQTHDQACDKGKCGKELRRGQLACLRHVATMTAAKAVMLAATAGVTGARFPLRRTALALALDAASHYALDRRWTLEQLAKKLSWMGKDGFYHLGMPREGKDDNPSLGTGAYALDQSAHDFFLWLAALLIASGVQR